MTTDPELNFRGHSVALYDKDAIKYLTIWVILSQRSRHSLGNCHLFLHSHILTLYFPIYQVTRRSFTDDPIAKPSFRRERPWGGIDTVSDCITELVLHNQRLLLAFNIVHPRLTDWNTVIKLIGNAQKKLNHYTFSSCFFSLSSNNGCPRHLQDNRK